MLTKFSLYRWGSCTSDRLNTSPKDRKLLLKLPQPWMPQLQTGDKINGAKSPMGQHGFWAWPELPPQQAEESSLQLYSSKAFASPAYRPAVPHLLGTRDQFRGRQLFQGPCGGGLVSGFFKCITFTVHFISDLLLLPAIRQQLAIWQQVLVPSLEVGDLCYRHLPASAIHTKDLLLAFPSWKRGITPSAFISFPPTPP